MICMQKTNQCFEQPCSRQYFLYLSLVFIFIQGHAKTLVIIDFYLRTNSIQCQSYNFFQARNKIVCPACFTNMKGTLFVRGYSTQIERAVLSRNTATSRLVQVFTNVRKLLGVGGVGILTDCLSPKPKISSRKTLRQKSSFCPVQKIEQSKCIKLTIDTNIEFTLYKALHFSKEPQKSVKFNLLL